jgi:hypothetical protein
MQFFLYTRIQLEGLRARAAEFRLPEFSRSGCTALC